MLTFFSQDILPWRYTGILNSRYLTRPASETSTGIHPFLSLISRQAPLSYCAKVYCASFILERYLLVMAIVQVLSEGVLGAYHIPQIVQSLLPGVAFLDGMNYRNSTSACGTSGCVSSIGSPEFSYLQSHIGIGIRTPGYSILSNGSDPRKEGRKAIKKSWLRGGGCYVVDRRKICW